MLIQPDVHITIVLTEEVIRLVCGTIAFVCMCLIVPKVITALTKNKTGEHNEIR